jgi:hypothetical protein
MLVSHRFSACMFAIACSVGIPVAADATQYTINVPVNLSRIAAPAGTQFEVDCQTYSIPAAAYVFNQTPGEAFGSADTPGLNAGGGLSATVPVKVTSTKPMLSYTCELNPVSSSAPNPYSLIPGFQQNPQSSYVRGSF